MAELHKRLDQGSRQIEAERRSCASSHAATRTPFGSSMGPMCLRTRSTATSRDGMEKKKSQWGGTPGRPSTSESSPLLDSPAPNAKRRWWRSWPGSTFSVKDQSKRAESFMAAASGSRVVS
ncbi:hypothetical protein WMF31_19935 [Sorangium sp. So ce1036]|uniref:hypothetical protein n=1 Tax=Sorangium sp. So ce1036 TaxID=3133328 RepID=UPI003F127760